MSSSEIPEQVAKLMKETGTNITNPKDLEALSKVSVRQLAKLFDELAKNSRANNMNKKSTADIFRSWTKAVVEQFNEGTEDQKKKTKSSADIYLDKKNQILTDEEMKERREELQEIEQNIARANTELERLKSTVLEATEKATIEQIQQEMEGIKESKRSDIVKSDQRKDVAFYKTIFHHKKQNNLVTMVDGEERDENGKSNKEFVEDSLFQDKWTNAGSVDEAIFALELNPSDTMDEVESKLLRASGSTLQGASSRTQSSSVFKFHPRNKKHPVLFMANVEKTTNGKVVANIVARCAGEDAAQGIKDLIEQSIDSIKESEAAEAEKKYLSYDDQTEKTSNIPLPGTKRLIDAWERVMKSVSTNSSIYPVYTRSGKEKGRCVMLGSDFKKHPVVLKADLRNDGGVYSVDLSCKTPTGDEKHGNNLIESVEAALFDTGFEITNQLNRTSLEITVPGIPDLEDAVKRLIDGAGSQPIGGDRSTKTGDLSFIFKKNKRHPIFMKAKLDEDDERVKVQLTLCGDDQALVEEAAKIMKETVEREEDPAEKFEDEWELAEDNESHRILDLNGEQNVDEATENFIHIAGIEPIGVVQQVKNDRVVNFYGRQGTKKHPVLMKAMIKRDDEGVVVADLTVRGPSKKEIKEDIETLRNALASKDPLSKFEAEFDNLGESAGKKDQIQFPKVSSLIDMFEKIGKAADSKPFVNRAQRRLGHIGYIGKKNPEHPVYLKGIVKPMEDGSFVAEIETRCSDETARQEFLERFTEDLFDNDWNKYGTNAEKSKAVEVLGDSIEDVMRQISDATGGSSATTVRKIGNTHVISIYGKKQGKHPVMLKVEVEQVTKKIPGIFKANVRARFDDGQLRDEVTNDVVTRLDPITTFDKLWDENKSVEKGELINMPNVKSLIDMFERLGKATDTPILRRPGKLGQFAFYAKNTDHTDKKHPVLLKTNIKENSDGTFSTELTGKSDDPALLQEAFNSIQESLFENEWQRLGEELESFNQIEISGDNIEAAIKKVSNAAGALPVGRIRTEGDKTIVTFYGKNNERKPVMLKAEISLNDSGKFLAVLQARAEDEDARDEVSLGLKDLLERGEDPASIFQDSWDKLEHYQELNPYELYSSDLNASTDKLIDDLCIVPVAPVNRDGLKNTIDFHGKTTDLPVLHRAVVDKDAEGNAQVLVSGKSENSDALSKSLKDIQDVLESKDPNNVFEKKWNELGEMKQQAININFPNVKNMTDAIEALISAAHSDPIMRRGDKALGKCSFWKKNQKHPLLIKAKVQEPEDGHFNCQLDARSELPGEEIIQELENVANELFKSAWEELGQGSSQNKIIPSNDLEIDDLIELLSEESELIPVMSVRKGLKSIKLLGKTNKKHPLLLKADFTKDADGNIMCCLHSICDDEADRLEAVNNIESLLDRVSNPLYRAALAKSNQFSQLGVPHKMSSPEAMTKKEDDVTIDVIKYALKEHAVVEIACKPTDPLETKLDYTKVMFGAEGALRPVKQSTTKSGSGFHTFAEMGTKAGTIEGTLVTLSRTDLKTGKNKKSVVPLGLIHILPGDFVRDAVVNYDKRWEELGENMDNEYLTQFEFAPQDDIKSAVQQILACCPLDAINKEEKVEADRHTLKFSGKAPKRENVDNNVLMQCSVARTPEGTVAMIAVCRSEDEVARVDIPEQLISNLLLNKNKQESDLFRDILSQHPAIAELGLPHKTSLTVHVFGNTELVVNVTKHTYPENVVLQFDCLNQAAACELNNLIIKLKENNPFINDKDGLVFERAIKAGVTPTGETSQAFIRLKKIDSTQFDTGAFNCNLKYDSKSIHPETNEVIDSTTPQKVDLASFKIYAMDYLADSPIEDVSSAFNALEDHNSASSFVLEKIDLGEVRDRALRAVNLSMIQYEPMEATSHMKFAGEVVDGDQVILNVTLKSMNGVDSAVELNARSTTPLLRDNLIRDVQELIMYPISFVIPEKNDNEQDEARRGRKPILDYDVDINNLPDPQWLRMRFDVLKCDPKKKWSTKAKRIWELDFFGGQFKNMDTKGVIKKCPEPAKLYHLERTPTDGMKVRMNFFEASHKYELLFTSNYNRERFYECAHALRPSMFVWCPSICAPGETKCRAEISGSFNIGNTGAQQKVSGSCFVNVTSKPYENISIWCGTWNMGGSVPPKDAKLMRKYIPANKHDLYVIAIQDSGYSKDKNMFIGYLQSILGKNEYVVLTFLTLWDIQLCVAARKRHFTKITNIQSEQRPTNIASAGTRGGVGVSLSFNETSMCFISAQLVPNTSDEVPNKAKDNTETRNSMIEDILGNLNLGNKSLDVNGQFHHVFIMGDLNYRIEMPAEEAHSLISSGQYEQLLAKDQLRQVMATKKVLFGFKEADIKFQPTFKFEKGTCNYDAKKPITPSYCDRILWKSMSNSTSTCVDYKPNTDVLLGDHLPVSAVFKVNTIRPFAGVFAKDQDTCKIVFESIKIKNRESKSKQESKQLTKPYLCFYAPFIDDGIVANKLPNSYNPEFLSHGLPVIEPSTCQKDFLTLQYLIISLMDESKESFNGSAALPLKNGLNTTDNVKITLDLVKFGKKVGDVEVTYKYIYRQKQQASNGSPLF